MIFNDSGYHYNDVIMGALAFQITSLTIVCSIVYSDADQRKHQSSASLAFVREIPRTNGQLRGKCFHLMTSSWCQYHNKHIDHYYYIFIIVPYSVGNRLKAWLQNWKISIVCWGTSFHIFKVRTYFLRERRRYWLLTKPSNLAINSKAVLGEHGFKRNCI